MNIVFDEPCEMVLTREFIEAFYEPQGDTYRIPVGMIVVSEDCIDVIAARHNPDTE